MEGFVSHRANPGDAPAHSHQAAIDVIFPRPCPSSFRRLHPASLKEGRNSAIFRVATIVSVQTAKQEKCHLYVVERRALLCFDPKILQKFRGSRFRWNMARCRRSGQRPQGDCPNSPQPYLFTHSRGVPRRFRLCRHAHPRYSCCEEADISINLVHLSQEFADILRAHNSRDNCFVVCIESKSHGFCKGNIDDRSGCHSGQWMPGSGN